MNTEFENRYATALEELFVKAPSFQVEGQRAFHPGIGQMERFAAFFNHPERSLSCIHVAGTNGKGSVAHLCASNLAAMHPDWKIGLYTSPHLLDFRERIRIVTDSGCRMISKEEVMEFLEEAKPFIDAENPSFFEITTMMCFWHFERSKVDMAVIETGLGGRLDSTNIISPRLSIITTIGYDHKDILGDSLEKISFEKAGIIKSGVPVVSGEMPQEALRVIESRAKELGSKHIRLCNGAPKGLSDPMFASVPQIFNVRILKAAMEALGEGLDAAAIDNFRQRTGLRGRWEKLADSPLVICDIGHNEQALAINMPRLELLPHKMLIMVIGMAADKDIAGVAHLYPDRARYHFVAAKGRRAMPSEKLAQVLQKQDFECHESVEQGLAAALIESEADDLVFIGGSSYVVSEALELYSDPEAASNTTLSV